MRALLPLLLLAGCGFPLGTVHRPIHMTAQQQQADTSECKEKSKGHFFAETSKAGQEKYRDVFTDCMTQKGYLVRPPT